MADQYKPNQDKKEEKPLLKFTASVRKSLREKLQSAQLWDKKVTPKNQSKEDKN